MIRSPENLPPPLTRSSYWMMSNFDKPSYSCFDHLPRISLVIPTYNQGQFIESTIRSVLGQYYPNLQLIIIDGGSTDQTLDIIKYYTDWLDYWVSEKDSGQSSAINKGMKKVDGDIVNWLNSDDFLEQDAFHTILKAVQKNPDAQMYYFGVSIFEDANSLSCYKQVPRTDLTLPEMLSNDWAYQPSVYFRGQEFRSLLPVNEELHYSMDVELRMRCLSKHGSSAVESCPKVLSNYRLHSNSKTVSQRAGFIHDNLWLAKQLLESINNSQAIACIDLLSQTELESNIGPSEFSNLEPEAAYEAAVLIVARCFFGISTYGEYVQLSKLVHFSTNFKFAEDVCNRYPIFRAITAKSFVRFKLGSWFRSNF